MPARSPVAPDPIALPLQQPVTLMLPYPVSANRYWRSYVVQGHVQTVVSSEAKAYRREVAWLLKIAKIREPIFGRIALTVTLHPKMPQDARQRMRKYGDQWEDGVSCIDLDNSLKILLDALKGRVFIDDRFVWRIHAERGEPTAEAHVEVTIARVPYVQPQQSLFDSMPLQPLIEDPFES
ncbi:RusA family crossover junction endodeoxyribonuclease [Paraburkholderia terrae]|uniref:RusA family crossover junction endodeoxyribonuclease n=1 Tax=Paraburkholderia terrae TaxID=311230 RepID=A0A2I8EUF3_9BURK|nr:RusA family crossover junction endodeoxyribonuclease [Paraburkholderia terrae]AUT62901.1 RusA family crossover junction endodeoxyribonuclease [Paraburkholderia terrae]